MSPIDIQKNISAENKFLFDPVRKKNIAALPEEKVRQATILYLIEKNYPRTLMAVEYSVTLNKLKKRCDIVVFKNSSPLMIVECKAPSKKIDRNVFEQIARYNLVLKVPYLLVSNGKEMYCCKIDFENSSFQFLQDVPFYSEL